jgi:hypothetical protein
MYIAPNMVHISPEFNKLMSEMFDRGLDFGLYRLMGDGLPGLYVLYGANSGWYTLTVGDYEDGLKWSLWNGCHDQETELQPWTNLDDCLKVFDQAVLWDANKEDELFPGLEWLPQGQIVDGAENA